MINEKQYLEAKAIVEAYERQLQQAHVMGSGTLKMAGNGLQLNAGGLFLRPLAI